MIHEPAKSRVSEGPGIDGPQLLNLMEQLAAEADEMGDRQGQTLIGFLEPEDEFVEGSWVPEIWIVVRKVTDES